MPYCLLALGLLGGWPVAWAETADIQFFGDVLITHKSLEQTSSAATDVFAASRSLLRSSRHNVANLEGVIATTLPALEQKTFHLRMPPSSAKLLRSAGFDAVTLANNHIMDFGFVGLLTTMNALATAGIAYTGAGINSTAAEAPLLIETDSRTICLLAFSKTLPSSFWASARRAGTAFASLERVQKQVEACSKAGYYTVAAFHWGQEGHDEPLDYQRILAHRAIDAGADLVIGHHPHIVQTVEAYSGRPIFYSLGNFAFGSEPSLEDQEGIAVRVTLVPDHQPIIAIVPLAVSSSTIHFQPRPLDLIDTDLLVRHLPQNISCPWRFGAWQCTF